MEVMGACKSALLDSQRMEEPIQENINVEEI